MTSPSKLASSFRNRLALDDSKASLSILRAYQPILSQIDAELKHIFTEVEQRKNAGLPVGAGWQRRSDKLQSFRAQVHREMTKFSKNAAIIAEHRQGQAVREAPDDSKKLLRSMGVDSDFTALHTAAIESLVGIAQDGGPLRDLFSEIAPQATDDAMAELSTGIALGRNNKVISEGVRNALGTSAHRALMITRTETQRAYREASRQSYVAAGVKRWVWKAYGDACGSCQAQSGQEFDTDQSLDSHPNCRCQILPIAEGSSFKVPSGVDTFADKSDSDQLSILGPTKFELYKSGKITLPDLVTHTESKRWGHGTREATVSEALAHARKR